MAFPEWLIYTLLLIGSYLIGSIPTGFLLGKILKKIDIRNYGSGNTGFSNVYRILGKGPAIFTIIGDVVIKGGVVAWSARLIIAYTIIKDIPESNFIYTMGYIEPIPQMFVMLSGLLTICGHNWPIWLKFKGGKGMATTAGVFICFVPASTALLTIVWFIVVITTRYTSLANLVTTPTLPIFILIESYFLMNLTLLYSLPLIIGGFLAGLLLIWTHRENIGRLLKGKERKFGDRSERINSNES